MQLSLLSSATSEAEWSDSEETEQEMAAEEAISTLVLSEPRWHTPSASVGPNLGLRKYSPEGTSNFDDDKMKERQKKGRDAFKVAGEKKFPAAFLIGSAVKIYGVEVETPQGQAEETGMAESALLKQHINQ